MQNHDRKRIRARYRMNESLPTRHLRSKTIVTELAVKSFVFAKKEKKNSSSVVKSSVLLQDPCYGIDGQELQVSRDICKLSQTISSSFSRSTTEACFNTLSLKSIAAIPCRT